LGKLDVIHGSVRGGDERGIEFLDARAICGGLDLLGVALGPHLGGGNVFDVTFASVERVDFVSSTSMPSTCVPDLEN